MKENPWARLLAYVTGLINQELLLKNEYLARRIGFCGHARQLRCGYPIRKGPHSPRLGSASGGKRWRRWSAWLNRTPFWLGTDRDYAVSQGLGFIPLRGERDQEHQFGLTIPLRGWSLDVNNYHQRARNYFDHNAIGNSNIFFPLTIDGARLYG
jgi:hypothetical protein